MSRNKAVLPAPKGGKEQDWEAKRTTAIRAWELGRKKMVPKFDTSDSAVATGSSGGVASDRPVASPHKAAGSQ
jgi:hypothetical protein